MGSITMSNTLSPMQSSGFERAWDFRFARGLVLVLLQSSLTRPAHGPRNWSPWPSSSLHTRICQCLRCGAVQKSCTAKPETALSTVPASPAKLQRKREPLQLDAASKLENFGAGWSNSERTCCNSLLLRSAVAAGLGPRPLKLISRPQASMRRVSVKDWFEGPWL